MLNPNMPNGNTQKINKQHKFIKQIDIYLCDARETKH